MKIKNKNTKSGNKKKESGVKNYCKACMIIRAGSVNCAGTSQDNVIRHTCSKTNRELNEFIYHMNIIHWMRRCGNFGREDILEL